MTIESLTAQLERVQTAIARIESGAQSYTHAERTKNEADLATLYKREGQLLARVNRAANGGGPRVRGVIYEGGR